MVTYPHKKTTEHFITDDSRKTAEAFFQQAICLGNDFKLGKLKKPLVNCKNQNQIQKIVFEPFPKQGKKLPKLLKEYQKNVLDGSVNWSWPEFMAFPDSNNSIAATAGHILQGMTSQNLCNSVHISPTATFVEIQLIMWMREAIGYKVEKNPKTIFDVGGVYTPGGVLSNTIALLLAREQKFPGTMKTGLKVDPSKLKIFMPSGVGHYSSKAAMGWLGLGINNIKLVKTAKGFGFDMKALEQDLKKSKAKGEIPLAIVAYSGDSRTMSIDNFDAIAKLAKKYGAWFHIDACHGSALAFSKKYKHLVKSMNKADSITLDPHKIFWMPYNLSYVLLKNPEDFKLISGSSDLITNEPFSFGQISPFLGSWGFHGLKLWFVFKNLGKKRVAEFIDQRTDIAKSLYKKIENIADFYMFNDVVINSIVFMYIPKDLMKELKKAKNMTPVVQKINCLNKNIRETLFEKKQTFVHTFNLADYNNILGIELKDELQMLRIMISNPLLSEEIRSKVLVKIQETAKSEYNKLKKNGKTRP